MFNPDCYNDTPFTSAAKPSNLKTNNRKAVLSLLRKHELLSVTEISELTGLSRTTAMKTINFLQLMGYVVSAGKGVSTFEGGKKPEIFRFNSNYGYVYCVTLLPTSVEGALLDMDASIIDRCKIGHAHESSPETIADNIALSFRLLREKNDITSEQVIMVAVGCDGIVNSDCGVICNSPHFRTWPGNLEISKLISDRLGNNCPVLVDNNVRFMAHSDLDKLTVEQSRDVIALMAEYGVGGCVLHNWQVIRGARFELGEFGHQIVNPFDDEVCECGGKGCFEKMIIEERVLRQAGKIFAENSDFESSSIASDCKNGTLSMQMIFDAANEGDAFARSVLDWVLIWFSVEFHNILLSHDPQVIIIYGTYVTAGEYFFSQLREKLNAMHFGGKGTDVEIITTEYDTETAFITGAGKYAIELFFTSDETYAD